jgi:outer membrane protein assembly factor BamE (lipoprotein component of BamABCDE complex)
MQLKRISKISLFFLVAVILALILVNALEKPFDAQKWQSEPLQRYEMVDDIIESQILSGKPKSEIIEILGQPDSKLNTSKDAFIYTIGDPPSFFSSQKEYLLIVFENQQVEEVTLAVQ